MIAKLKGQSNRISIVDASCLNHLIHNSFLGAIDNCGEFQSLINNITFLVSILRKKKQLISLVKK